MELGTENFWRLGLEYGISNHLKSRGSKNFVAGILKYKVPIVMKREIH